MLLSDCRPQISVRPPPHKLLSHCPAALLPTPPTTHMHAHARTQKEIAEREGNTSVRETSTTEIAPYDAHDAHVVDGHVIEQGRLAWGRG